MYSKITLFILIILCSSTASLKAQLYWVSGYVKETESEKPLEFAQVAIMTEDTNMVSGDVSGHDGYFEISRIAAGNYLLRASYVGFTTLWLAIEVSNENLSLGTLTMDQGVSELSEVVIEGAATLFRTEGDRRIYNVGDMAISDGGTAIDLLETIPSIQIDQEGQLTMRGSGNIRIHINGRPTNLSADDIESVLEQYPAHAIQSVELITNPSARYDAEGSGGIINIILKEEKRNGLRGQVDLSAGSRHKYSGGLNLNYRQNRFNIFTAYSYQYFQREVGNLTERNYKIEGISPYLVQDHSSTHYDQTHLVRSGVTYDFSLEHQASVFGSLNLRSRERDRVFDIYSMQNPEALDSMNIRYVDEEQSRSNWEAGVEYLWRPLDNEDQSFRLTFTYASEEQSQFEHFEQLYYDAGMNRVDEKLERHHFESPSRDQLLIGQADYEGPLSESIAMESGLKSTITIESREQQFSRFDFDNRVFVEDEVISDAFDFEESVHAAYFSINGQAGALDYQSGLRGEYTIAESSRPESSQSYSDSYFNLFPSVHLNYALGENHDIQLSYSRRIRRPGASHLSPFINIQDIYNLRLGNPELSPAFNNNYEISHIRAWERFSLTSGIFHRETRNAMTRIIAATDDGRLVTTWHNAATRNASGLELIKFFTAGTTYDVSLTSEFYHALIEGNDGERDYSNRTYSYGFSMMHNIRIPEWFNIQLGAFLQGPRVIPQGHIEPRYHIDIGLRRNMLDNQATVSLGLTDVFNTREFTLYSENANFEQMRNFKRESRVLTLSFTYRFSDGREEF